MTLAPRQRNVLRYAAAGLSNTGIADTLHCTEKAVERALEEVYSKMGIKDDPNISPRVRAVVVYLGAAPVTVLAAHRWKTNGDLIADVAKLGYLDGHVLDVTYGEGVFWKRWRPDDLVTSDIKKGIAEYGDDFTDLSWPRHTFDSVVFDPPYKLNGTPSEPDVRYGVDVRATPQERMRLCKEGATECARVLKPGGYLLWKCQDQVSSGEVRWQTYEFTHYGYRLGLHLVDRFDMLGTTRQQPAGRRQVHAHGRPSTLLVFRKPA